MSTTEGMLRERFHVLGNKIQLLSSMFNIAGLVKHYLTNISFSVALFVFCFLGNLIFYLTL